MENQNKKQEDLKDMLDELNSMYQKFSEQIPKCIQETMLKTLRNIITNVNVNLDTIVENFIEDHEFDELQIKVLRDSVRGSSSKAVIETLNSIVPPSHIKPNNRLANTMTQKPMIGDGAIDLVVSSKKAKYEVRTKVMLEYDRKYVELWGGWEQFTPYDREVYDGVVSLYAAGNTIINPAMVYRAMNGLTNTEYVKPEALEKVRQSLNKSMHIEVLIDYTAEARMYNKDIQKTIYEGRLLAAEKATVEINGEKHEAYKLLRSPILYEYAQVSGQIITVPMKLLNTKKAVRSTDEVTVIRGYLIRQIGWMRDTNTTRSDHITYQKIYDELSVSKKDLDNKAYENKTRKIRSHVKAILDEWKEEGYIIDHAEYKDGKTIKGIKMMI